MVTATDAPHTKIILNGREDVTGDWSAAMWDYACSKGAEVAS